MAKVCRHKVIATIRRSIDHRIGVLIETDAATFGREPLEECTRVPPATHRDIYIETRG